MIVLGIESTCDETACALVKDGRKILSHVVASQVDLHEKYGGVFPELASRRHLEAILPVLTQCFAEASIPLGQVDRIAVANGPGLIGSLLIGVNTAKALSWAWDVPIVGVNHVEAHLYAAMMEQEPPLPALGLVVSGGHTLMAKVHALGEYEMIGSTQDDAVGEAFDKVATLLGLPYPGGPAIEALARTGNPHRFPFRSGQVKGRPRDFSFSGLKTSVLYAIRDKTLSPQDKADVAASFQEVALLDIATKAHAAALNFQCQSLLVGGGVSCNLRLQTLLKAGPLPLFLPPKGLSLDNGAMIAGLGYAISPLTSNFQPQPGLALPPRGEL